MNLWSILQHIFYYYPPTDLFPFGVSKESIKLQHNLDWSLWFHSHCFEKPSFFNILNLYSSHFKYITVVYTLKIMHSAIKGQYSEKNTRALRLPSTIQISREYFNSLLYKTNRFQVAVCLFSNRSQMTSKGGKNISATLGCASCATFLFLPHFDVICDLSLNRRTATWNLFVKWMTWGYKKEYVHRQIF